jgi:hypothetical protein
MVYAPGAESSVASLLDAAMSRMEESTMLQLPLDITTTILVLDRKNCLLRSSLPQVSLLDASLTSKELPPGGADEWALEHFAP